MTLQICDCPEGPCPHYPWRCKGHVLLWRQGRSGLARRLELYYLGIRVRAFLGRKLNDEELAQFTIPGETEVLNFDPPVATNHGTVKTGEVPDPAPPEGPGTEMKAILQSLGAEVSWSCGCNAKADEMNRWGIDGCKEKVPKIVEWLRQAQERLKWGDKILMGFKLTVKADLLFRIDPLNYLTSIVEEAIRRAEVKRDRPPPSI